MSLKGSERIGCRLCSQGIYEEVTKEAISSSAAQQHSSRDGTRYREVIGVVLHTGGKRKAIPLGRNTQDLKQDGFLVLYPLRDNVSNLLVVCVCVCVCVFMNTGGTSFHRDLPNTCFIEDL